jgi:hypothetical protein
MEPKFIKIACPHRDLMLETGVFGTMDVQLVIANVQTKLLQFKGNISTKDGI